jgi:Flp pilus assembly protein TadD
MNKYKLFLISGFLLGVVTTAIPVNAQAQVLVAQSQNVQLSRMLEEGRHLVDIGDYNGAIAIYKEASYLEPKNASIYSGIGYLNAQAGNFAAAAVAYRQAVALNPNSGAFQYALGYVSANLGDYNTAKEAYRHAVQLERSNKNAYLGLGVVLSHLRDYDNAVWAYEQAISLDSRNGQAYELIGKTFVQQGRRGDAIATLNRARDLYQSQGKQEGVERTQELLQQLR